MANAEHREILKKGVAAWNEWREANPTIRPDLSGASLKWRNLSGANLSGTNLDQADLGGAMLCQANLYQASLNEARLPEAALNGAALNLAQLGRANLAGANLNSATLKRTDLNKADLSGADLSGAYLYSTKLAGANLAGADLSSQDQSRAFLCRVDLRKASLLRADLSGAFLKKVDLTGADLSGACLEEAIISESRLDNAVLRGCLVYNLAVPATSLDGTVQAGLVITPAGSPASLTVDNLTVARLAGPLLKEREAAAMIESKSLKVVLVAGNFGPEQAQVLQAVREEAAKIDCSLLVYNLKPAKGPALVSLVDLVLPLAGLTKAVIIDLSGMSEVPEELSGELQKAAEVPVLLVARAGQAVPGLNLVLDWARFHGKGRPYRYENEQKLAGHLEERLVQPVLRARLDQESLERLRQENSELRRRLEVLRTLGIA